MGDSHSVQSEAQLKQITNIRALAEKVTVSVGTLIFNKNKQGINNTICTNRMVAIKKLVIVIDILTRRWMDGHLHVAIQACT